MTQQDEKDKKAAEAKPPAELADRKEKPKGVATWVRVVSLILLLAPFPFIGWMVWTYPCAFYTGIVLENYTVFFGMPYGALFAYFLVATLENTAGQIKFEFFGLKFEGASGPLVFWILIFLAFVASVHLLWHPRDPLDFKCDVKTLEEHPEWRGPKYEPRKAASAPAPEPASAASR